MLTRLKHRHDFVRLNRRGQRASAVGLVVQVAKTPDDAKPPPGPDGFRVGFTATKKLGSAVIRNRVKRRLRVLAETMLPTLAKPGHDFVLIGRQATARRGFQALEQDFKTALTRLDMTRLVTSQPAGEDRGTTPETNAS
ncbi:MAG: ribonuclease P protein component [Pseudomonadota bacterium]